MRQSPDTTLFAWDSVDNDDPHRACLFAASPSSFDSFNSRAIVHKPNPTQQARQTDDDIETDDEVETDNGIETDDEIEVVSRSCSGCSFRVLVRDTDKWTGLQYRRPSITTSGYHSGDVLLGNSPWNSSSHSHHQEELLRLCRPMLV